MYEKAIELINSDCPEHRLSGQCDWYLTFANIGLGEFVKARENIANAEKNWDGPLLTSEERMNALVSRYLLFLEDTSDPVKQQETYRELRDWYSVMTLYWPTDPKYHESLALAYSFLGEFEKAKAEAQIVLKLDPSRKDAVEQFINSLAQ